MIRIKELMKRDLIAVGSDDAEFEASVCAPSTSASTGTTSLFSSTFVWYTVALSERPSHGLHSLATRGRRGMERLAR